MAGRLEGRAATAGSAAKRSGRGGKAPTRKPSRTRPQSRSLPLEGTWDVRRESGLLPPFVSKQIGPETGWTRWLGVPVGKFEVDGLSLHYRLWPVRDELWPEGDGFTGRGFVFGIPFCRFRLERRSGERVLH